MLKLWIIHYFLKLYCINEYYLVEYYLLLIKKANIDDITDFNIEFHFEDIVVPDFNPEFFCLWISDIVELHQKEIGELNYIFCSDDYILDINKQHLISM